MIADPIFIVGTERSGSNLLRLILNEHEGISIPHPPHLMRDLHPNLQRYGDLARDENFRKLIQDAVLLVELHFMPWEFRVDAKEVFGKARGRCLYAIYAQIQDQYLRASGKRRWGCKSTFMIHHVDEILRSHPRPRIIHLVRDGRDVAVSARKSVFSGFHPHFVSKLWSAQQRLAIEASGKTPPGFFRTFRYEALVAHPEETVRGICDFLGEEFSPRMLRYFERSSAAGLARMSESWSNCGKPIIVGNFGKFQNELSEEELSEFERISHRELAHFGYALVNDPSRLEANRPTSLALLAYYAEEIARSAMVELRSLRSDRNARLRLRKRLFLFFLGLKSATRSHGIRSM